MLYQPPKCGCGDLDGDGVITLNDYHIAESLLNTNNLDRYTLQCGDLNRNGVIDRDDLNQIRDIASGLRSSMILKSRIIPLHEYNPSSPMNASDDQEPCPVCATKMFSPERCAPVIAGLLGLFIAASEYKSSR